jgi:hypothetical protein
MLEIFYLLIIFNVIMFIIGGITLPNGNKIGGNLPEDVRQGDAEGFYSTYDENNVFIAGIAGLTTIMTAVIASLVIAYGLTMLPTQGNARTPMVVIYGFAIAFQAAYMAAWWTFWNPLSTLSPVIAGFQVLFAFLVESIFAIGMIQMSTGGWGLYK